jgi:DMSO reductase anchor subunit
MHPATSIIVFTTLSGLGYGLAAVLGLGMLDPAALSTRISHVLALFLIAAGLSSSTLHLRNPQRAWRAFSQWRSSWLSREGVMAVLTFLPLVWAAWGSVVEGRYLLLPGLLGTVLSAVTVYCTAMIYASLKSVDAWHTPLTPACYLLFAAAGGFLLAGSFAAVSGSGTVPTLFAAVILLIAAWIAKTVWWRRLDGLTPLSTPESATGLGFIGQVRLFERPHVNENYLTREMGFRVARKHAAKLRSLALGFGALAPVLLSFLAMVTGGGAIGSILAALATLFFLAGVLAERWLFFATARHAVMNYYGG